MTDLTDNSAADQAVWDDLSLVLDQLDQAARGGDSPTEFYRGLLAKIAPLLAASAGAVWLREAGTSWRPVAQSNDWATAINDRATHESLIANCMATAQLVLLSPGDSIGEAANPSSDYLLLCPVSLDDWTGGATGTVAVVELRLPPGRSPSSYQGATELLRATCQVAAEYHVRRELSQAGSMGARREALLEFGERLGGSVDLGQTAMRIANQGCQVAGCDRLSVLTATNRSARLWATSGTDHVQRRGRAARALERLALQAAKLDEPIYYNDQADDATDAMPQVADLLQHYVDEFHTRAMVVMPVADGGEQSPSTSTRGVLIAEQFSSQADFDRMHVAELARASSAALTTAIAWHEIPLAGLLQSLTWLRRPRTLLRLFAALLVLMGVAVALLTIPAPLTVDAGGRLAPVQRRDVFAPASTLVDRVLVGHGDQVSVGQTLVELRDPQLEIEIERITGEKQQIERQLEAVRTTRTTVDTRNRDPLEIYRLSAEQEQLKTKLQNLSVELELLHHQADALVVTSPLEGRVTTWQVGERLTIGRPVERGQVLLSLANTTGAWQLELDVPDDRLDLLRTADKQPLAVEYRLGSDARELHHATVTRIAERVDRQPQPTGEELAVVRVEALPDTPVPDELRAAALRPGGTVRARLVVGQRAIGYVWTNDLWRALKNWWEF